MGLFSPAWKSKDKQKRITAISKLKDIEIIKNLALNDPSLEVRREAMKKIKDKDTLVAIVLNNVDRENKLLALCVIRFSRMETPENVIELCKIIQTELNKTISHTAGSNFIEEACKRLCAQNAPISEIELWASVSAGWGQHLKSRCGIHRNYSDSKLNPITMEYELD